MTDKELVHRALLGDEQAQQECTEKGIVLPCPFCGSDSKVFADIDLFGVRCVDSTCIGHDMRAEYYLRYKAIENWNTRPAPPIERCEDCKYYTAMSHCQIHSLGPDQYDPEDFCSYFEPKED